MRLRTWLVLGVAVETLGLLVILAPFFGDEPGLRVPNLVTGIPLVVAGAILTLRAVFGLRLAES